MTFIRSIAFNLLYFGWTAALMLSLWTLMPFPARTFRKGIRLWSVGSDWLLENIVGTRIEIRGRERVPDKPVIFAAKHQSAWDTMAFLKMNAGNAYVMKMELLRIPLWGWYMRKADHAVVDRKGGISSLHALTDQVGRIIGDGRSVVIFPEGTRVPPGETGRYFPGIAALTARIDTDVVPVAVNSGVFWGRRQFVKRPGTIVLEFLEPMPKGLARRPFMEELENRIENASRRLEEEASRAGAR